MIESCGVDNCRKCRVFGQNVQFTLVTIHYLSISTCNYCRESTYLCQTIKTTIKATVIMHVEYNVNNKLNITWNITWNVTCIAM